MSSTPHRRDFLRKSAQAGVVAGLADFSFLRGLPALGAADVPRSLVPLEPDVEPLVRLIEETERSRLLETIAERIRGGLGYQPLLAALMLAGVRSLKPRPVGFRFHAVLVVNSAHLASLAAADQDRWLPLLWALDNFKASQVDARQGNYAMPVVEESRVPPAGQAAAQFRTAVENWDEAGADAGAAGLARGLSANEAYEMLWRFGARDFRDIGHKAIFVANSYRTLQTIGWRHAEPILRSLTYALLEHEGDNPARRDADQDRPGRDNLNRLRSIRADWQRGRVTREATTDLLATLRSAGPGDACEAVVRLLNSGIDPSCVWDALFLMAGELLMRQPGIAGLHTVTSTNALHFGYETSASDETRRFLLLQATAFLPMFRRFMQGRGLADLRIDTLAPDEARPQVAEVFTAISRDRLSGARKMLALVQADQAQVQPLMAEARRLIFARGSDSHDYKFSSAALEDFYHVSPAWRDRYLASSVYWLKGSGGQNTPLFERARAALGRV